MRVHIPALIASLLLFGACASPTLPTLSTRDLSGDEAAVLEATFRHLFVRNYSALHGRAKAYCLLIKSAMPDRAFIDRFSDLSRTFRARTRYRPGADLIFQVTSVTKVHSTFYRVEAGYYEGPVSGSSAEFEVRYKDGRWHVALNPAGIELISQTANKAPEPMTTAARDRAI